MTELVNRSVHVYVAIDLHPQILGCTRIFFRGGPLKCKCMPILGVHAYFSG